jgi:hypothetical protein
MENYGREDNLQKCKTLSPDRFCIYEINCLIEGVAMRPPFVLVVKPKQAVGAFIGRPQVKTQYLC